MTFLARSLLVIAFALALPSFGATQVDVNSADARMLAQTLVGVGLVKAEAIVAYRKDHGPFARFEDLARVEGIGPRVIEENRDRIVFGKPIEEAPHSNLQRPLPGGW